MNEAPRTSLTRLACQGGLLCLVFATINLVWLYPAKFGLKTQPIAATVSLYFLASGLWLWSLRTTVSLGPGLTQRRLTLVVFWFAVCFRAIQICAPPILELDLYRYMWDGIVASNGTSPYSYSPQQVLTQDVVIEDQGLRKLSELATKTPSHHAIVSTVHFAEYTTIYPPASQVVFAVTMCCVPDGASVVAHVTAMKIALVVFDLLTMTVVLWLIRMTGLQVGWLVAYGWNPLVIKEIANSGHLDSIAVFFVVAAVYLLLSANKLGAATGVDVTSHGNAQKPFRFGWPGIAWRNTWRNAWREFGSALCLSVGTAAKLFPVILVPLFAMVLICRRGWSSAARYCVLYLLLSAAFMSWMLLENDFVQSKFGHQRAVASSAHENSSKEGLNGFLKHWRMNDCLFTFVFENCKPDGTTAVNRAWYVVTPDSWRQSIDRKVRAAGWSDSPPFFVARVFSLTAFAVLYLVVLMRMRQRLGTTELTVWRNESSQLVLEASFLVLAIFFVLQPTQNPWYWVWALPFVCFASNRGWLLVSVCLRFLFKFSELEFQFCGILYKKAAIFDHCVAWLEHAAIFGAVIVGMMHKMRRQAQSMIRVPSH